MIVTGVIHSANLNCRYISILINKKLTFFSLQNHLVKKFRKYLHKGRFVQFECYDDADLFCGRRAYKVKHFIKIIRKRYRSHEIYYDIEIIRQGIVDVVNNMENIMFLDMEMTMHDWNVSRNFTSEIIQAGFIITNNKGEELEVGSHYVKPTLFKKLTKRTKNFLHITDNDLEAGLTYNEFYDYFNNILDKYDPTIIVWGKNDIISLKDSYTINGKESLEKKCNFVNILQVQKNYFNLKNDLGLFKALKIYTGVDPVQIHDALEDARVTKEVFFAFKKIINEGTMADFEGV